LAGKLQFVLYSVFFFLFEGIQRHGHNSLVGFLITMIGSRFPQLEDLLYGHFSPDSALLGLLKGLKKPAANYGERARYGQTLSRGPRQHS
jgi:hypothetical protein